MKIIANKQEIITKLTATAEIANDNKIRPILGCIKLSAINEKITLTATDLELTVISDVVGDVMDLGEVVFKADKVIEYMATLGNSITLESKGNILTISETGYDETTADFPTMDIMDYPNIKINIMECINIDSERLYKSMSSCLTVSKTVIDNNTQLMGVRLEITNKVACVASDTFRMVYSEFPINDNLDMQATIPNNAVFQVLKLLKTCKKVDIAKENGQMIFNFGDYKLATRLISLEYVNYKALLANLTFNRTVTINTDQARKTLKRVCIIARENVTARNAVIFKISNNKIDLNAISGNGKIKDKIECMKEGDDLKINLNADFLLKYIETVESEVVEIKLQGPGNPIIMQGTGNNKTWFLTMPLAMIE